MSTENDAPEPAAPAGETKAQAFRRLAEYRMQRLIKNIRQLGNLANRSTYEYEQEQVARMQTVLTQELDNTFRKFQPEQKDEKLFEF